MRFLAAALTVLSSAVALDRARAAEALVIPYGQPWEFLNPMGTNPRVADPDFDSTWWLSAESFQSDYNGPSFSTPSDGSPGVVTSINSGTGSGPLGYGSVDNWNGQSTPLLHPFGGGLPIMSMGTVLTTPNNSNRKGSYYRTTFYTSQAFTRPIIRCMIDDGAVIFIDGVQVARVNLSLPAPTSLPTYTTVALGDGTMLPVPQSTEDTLHTIDLSMEGNQGTPGGLQATVVNPVASLIAGSHTMAVFVCSFSASSSDQLMALQMTADDAGILAVASNVSRNLNGTPGNPLDDTFEFDATVTQTGNGTQGWTSNAPQRPAGSYGQVYRFNGFPATGQASITFKDATSPVLSSILKVDPPPAPLIIGQVLLPGQSGPLPCTSDTDHAWVQTGAETVQQTNGGGAPHLLKSVPVSIPAAGAAFEAILEFEDASSAGNFETTDTFEARLLLNNGSTVNEVNVLPASLDKNSDGILNGYTGSDYNTHIASDEFNLAASTAEMVWTEGIVISHQIPPGTVSAQLVIRAVNDHLSETFRVKGVRFAPVQASADRDLDGTSDADELSAGTDPFDATSSLKVSHVRNGNSIALSFPTVASRAYRVLSSDDMVTWTQENQNSIIGDGTVQAFSLISTGQRKFICVQVKRGLQAFP
jgi:hypothetical protein